MTEIRIQAKIFEEYPTFRRRIVIARNMDNRGHSPELEAILSDTIAQAAQQPIDLKADPRTKAWNDAYRQFGSNPNKFPPAHCALLKRVQQQGARIPFINKVVAIMNINSIRDATPVGGDDVMRAGGILELRHADGSETFTPLGNPDTKEQPVPGEVIYVVPESKEVMCRRWNWRNGHKTRIAEDTQIIVMNIDSLGDNSEARSIDTRDRVAQMLEAHCQAEVTTTFLSPTRPFHKFEY
ncbi:MAG: phenylalanine--tRNA ligase beta subunit-related protein [Desulfobacterales bacterium]|jgi:DNA/RNA-binding domain of Phe-tRNA-synthetase-like protein